MKEYAIIILIIAVAVTLVAVAAGAIVYLRVRHGSDSPVFQLSRIGVIWATTIALLLLFGLLCATVTGWTTTSISDALAWLEGNDVIGATIRWAQENRCMAAIILWSVSALVLMLLYYLGICTAPLTIIVCTLHVWGTYIIWQNAPWPVIKTIVFVVAIIWAADEEEFQTLPRRHDAEPEAFSAPPTGPAEEAQPEAAQPETADHRHPIEVISDLIEDCAETLAETVTDR